MFRVIYSSRTLPHIRTAEMMEIARAAQSFNASRQITGLLAWNGRNVVQVLEGDRIEVTRLLDRIRLDHRHRDVGVALAETIQTRGFPDWAMQFWQVDQPILDATAIRDRANGYFATTPDHVRLIFSALRESV